MFSLLFVLLRDVLASVCRRLAQALRERLDCLWHWGAIAWGFRAVVAMAIEDETNSGAGGNLPGISIFCMEALAKNTFDEETLASAANYLTPRIAQLLKSKKLANSVTIVWRKIVQQLSIIDSTFVHKSNSVLIALQFIIDSCEMPSRISTGRKNAEKSKEGKTKGRFQLSVETSASLNTILTDLEVNTLRSASDVTLYRLFQVLANLIPFVIKKPEISGDAIIVGNASLLFPYRVPKSFVTRFSSLLLKKLSDRATVLLAQVDTHERIGTELILCLIMELLHVTRPAGGVTKNFEDRLTTQVLPELLRQTSTSVEPLRLLMATTTFEPCASLEAIRSACRLEFGRRVRQFAG